MNSPVSNKPKINIVLDNVRSAFNVGAIFRTADGLGAEITLIGMSPSPGKDKKLDKTSLSAINHVSWSYFKTAEDWMHHIKNSSNFLILSIEEGKDFKNKLSLFELEKFIDFNNFKQIFLVFGHEINGVSNLIMENSDNIIQIPMNGVKNSLNVATCVGVVSYRICEILEKLN